MTVNAKQISMKTTVKIVFKIAKIIPSYGNQLTTLAIIAYSPRVFNCFLRSPERLRRRKLRRLAKLLLNPQKPVILCGALRPARRTGFDLPRIHRDRKIRDKRILRLPGTVGDHRVITGTLRHLDGIQRFRQRADLIHLYQHRISRI